MAGGLEEGFGDWNMKTMTQVCDRCGQKVIVEDQHEALIENRMQWVKLANILGDGYRTVDLCPECVRGLLEYLGMENRNGKTEET